MEKLQPELGVKNNIPDELFEKLRLSQKKSLDVAFSYIQQEDNSKSAVISLPTGGGKTGVICLLSHYSPQKKVLVLCHRKAVKKQLENQISKGFFKKIGVETNPPKLLRGDISDVSEMGIYVSTFQKLRAMSEDEMVALRAAIDLVIVDEGHSEPSPEWSRLTRGLESHKVVVTATPYRNDLFQFDVSHNYAYFYSFSEAVNSKDIEEPNFEMVQKDKISCVVREFLDKYKGAKCIVKCKERSDVEEYFRLFNDEFKVLAIHDAFVNDSRGNVKADVPADLIESDVEVIIHQRKLDEGIDLPQAKLLVLTYTVGSGRELVQTVGRVVRRYNNIPSQVKEFEGCGNSKIWRNYIQFDEYLSSPAAAKKFFKALDLSSLLNSYMDSFPDVSYLGNNYARKLDLSSDALIDAIKIPLLSVVFKNKVDGFDFQEMVDTLSLRSIREGEYVKHLNLETVGLSENIKGFVSISFNSSKFLEGMFFFEPKINIFIVKDFKRYVAIFDSKGRRFIKEKNLKLGRSASISDLLSLAGETQKVRTKEMSASSIGSSNRRPDSLSMKSYELERNSISQSNSAYAISTTKISNINENEKVESSYYIGSLSGRVSDQMKSGLTLLQFSEWLDVIYERLCEGNVTSSSLLKSYAIPVDEAPKSNASIIILDLGKNVGIEVDGEIYDFPDELLYIEYEEDCGALLPNVKCLNFSIEYNTDEKSVSIVFQRDGVLILDGERVETSISDFLSDHIGRILYEDGLCYSGNHFYKYRLPTQDGFDPKGSGLDYDFISLPELTNENLKEKYEEHVESDEFHSNSIFYMIDQLKNVAQEDSTRKSLGPFYNYIPGLDLMLCTDMGTEQADFVLSSKSKLVFIHVKCGGTTNPQSSAGAIFEVGSQAIKNLEHMISSSEDLKASNRGYMVNPWPSKTAVKKLNERVRLLNGERFVNPENDSKLREEVYDQAWDEVIARRLSPRIEKEIWIVSGNAFSKKHFFNELNKGEKGKSESLQAYQLIQSWYTSLAAEDVGIKFFVSI